MESARAAGLNATPTQQAVPSVITPSLTSMEQHTKEMLEAQTLSLAKLLEEVQAVREQSEKTLEILKDVQATLI